jgi:hypothetical protein
VVQNTEESSCKRSLAARYRVSSVYSKILRLIGAMILPKGMMFQLGSEISNIHIICVTCFSRGHTQGDYGIFCAIIHSQLAKPFLEAFHFPLSPPTSVAHSTSPVIILLPTAAGAGSFFSAQSSRPESIPWAIFLFLLGQSPLTPSVRSLRCFSSTSFVLF